VFNSALTCFGVSPGADSLAAVGLTPANQTLRLAAPDGKTPKLDRKKAQHLD